MNETTNKCPGCGRHCDLSAPSCPRGEAFARGESPENSGFKRGEHDRGEHSHGEHEHGEGRREYGGREHRQGEFRGRERGRDGEKHGDKGRMSREEYEALDLDGKLSAKLNELNHVSRFVMDSRGGQGRILRVLAEEGTMTQRALTEKLGIQPGSASEVIGKLERAGLLTRTENESDRRTADVRLTEQGLAQAESGAKEKPALFSALDEGEKQQLLTLLEKLSADWRGRGEHGHGHGRFGKDKD